jgi:hypothetical protein
MAQKFLNGIDVSSTTVVNGSNLDSGSTVLDVQGSQGQLFSVTNSLTGDLFSVSDISGIHILNVNSSGAVKVDGYIDGDLEVRGQLKITGDGSNAVTFTESGNGDFTIDAPDDIRIDAGGGDIVLRAAGTEFSRLKFNNPGLDIQTSQTNSNIYLTPNGTGNVYASTDTFIINATEGESASILLRTDQGDDNGDDWYIYNGTDNVLDFSNDISGSQVNMFTLTPHATASSSIATFAGKINAIGGSGHAFMLGNSNNTTTADTSGFRLHQSSYADGRYTHRFRKYDESGGVPLYIDGSAGTANVFTALARFGAYTNESKTFEVFGTMGATNFSGSSSGTNTGDQVLPSDFVSKANGGTFDGNLTINIADDGSSPAMTSLLNLRGFEGRGAGIKIKDSANSDANSSNREWFIGSGYSQSGFNIGYSATGSQSSYAGQNKFTLTTAGNATFAGTVAGTNLSGTNTGDQDLSGYLTSLPSHNHDDRYYTESEVNQNLAALKGWVPAYSNSDASTINWNFTTNSLEIQSDNDATTGASFQARRIEEGETIRVTFMAKASAAASAGFYTRLYQHNGNMPDGKTHVSNDASASSVVVQEDDGAYSAWNENVAITTDWVTYEKTYTATSDGYVSLVILNWTGIGANTLYVTNPDIQTTTAGDSDKLDGQEGTHYLDYNNFTNTPTIPPTNAEQNVQANWTETTTTSDAFILNNPGTPYLTGVTDRHVFPGLAANAGQARKHHIGRVYYCPKHWDTTWQNIYFTLNEETYNSGYVKYHLFGYYNATEDQTLNLKVVDYRGNNGDIQRYKIVLGNHTDAGWDHSSQNVYYTDIYVEVAYYKSVKVVIDALGHPILHSNPTSGAGITVIYETPTVTDITYTDATYDTTYLGANTKIWNSANDGSGSGLDADTVDGTQGNLLKRINGEFVLDVNDDFDSETGTWATGTGSAWGEPNVTGGYAYNDGTGSRTYDVPTGAESCWISHLTWSSGGYIDVLGVQSDGGEVFLRRINTHQTVQNSDEGAGQHDGSTITFAGTSLSSFGKIKFKNRTGRFHLTGITFSSSQWEGTEGTGMVHAAQITQQGTGGGLDSDKLDGQQGTYYLNYNNFTNTPTDFVSAANGGDFSGPIVIKEGRVWSATTQGTTTGSLHIDPESGTDHAGGAITFGASDHSNGAVADAGIYIRSDGSYGTKMYFSTTDSYATGSKTAMYINHDKDVYFLDDIDIAGQIRIASALISNQENTNIDASTSPELVGQVATSYTAAFFDFVVKKGTNVRSGTVYACHDGTNVEFTETSTNDLGDTSDVTLSVDISGTNMRLLATVTSDDWSVKSLIRAI